MRLIWRVKSIFNYKTYQKIYTLWLLFTNFIHKLCLTNIKIIVNGYSNFKFPQKKSNGQTTA